MTEPVFYILDEKLSQKVVFLLIELYLTTMQVTHWHLHHEATFTYRGSLVYM